MIAETGQHEHWRMRVLVVEDQAESAASLAQLLRLAGHDVEIACDGPAAVESVHTNSPDVVLLDLGLPKMNGWEVASQIRQQSLFKTPLMVAVTAHGAEEDRQHSEQAGIDLHLTKPVDAGALQELLQRFCSVIAEE